MYSMEIRFWNRYPCTFYRALFCFNNSFHRARVGGGGIYLLAFYKNQVARNVLTAAKWCGITLEKRTIGRRSACRDIENILRLITRNRFKTIADVDRRKMGTLS